MFRRFGRRHQPTPPALNRNADRNVTVGSMPGLRSERKVEVTMPGLAGLAMGAAPVVGGALLGAAVGQLRGPDLREGIKQDLELLEQMPEMEAARREALRRSIDDRIDELIVAEDKARQLRAAASSYEGSWRDIVLFLCTVLFSIVWWSVDHDRDSWLPVFITTVVASVVAGGYAVRGLRRSARRMRRRADRRHQS
jgi:hypothetical protein